MEPLILHETEIGSYRLDGLIGRGGMAEVYKAWNIGLHRHEALKVLPPQMTFDPFFVERFLKEARMAAGLHHPHIATVHAVSAPGAPQNMSCSKPAWFEDNEYSPMIEGGSQIGGIQRNSCFSTLKDLLPGLRTVFT